MKGLVAAVKKRHNLEYVRQKDKSQNQNHFVWCRRWSLLSQTISDEKPNWKYCAIFSSSCFGLGGWAYNSGHLTDPSCCKIWKSPMQIDTERSWFSHGVQAHHEKVWLPNSCHFGTLNWNQIHGYLPKFQNQK